MIGGERVTDLEKKIYNELDFLKSRIYSLENHYHCSRCGKPVFDVFSCGYDKQDKPVCRHCLIKAGAEAIKK